MIFKLFLLSTLVGLASSACFDNGDKEIGGSCYKFVAQKLSFEDARNWCHYKNPVTASYLAYVPNQFTSNFLASYARSAFGTNDGSFWIGLSRKSGGSWSWDAGFPIGYTNFGDQVGQNYVAESIVNAKWNTFGASDTNFFVCGYDPAAPPTFAPQTAGPSGPTPTMRATTQPVPTTTVSPRQSTSTPITDYTTVTVRTQSTRKTTENVIPTTTAAPLCANPFSGNITTIFELNASQAEIQYVADFVTYNLYNSANYDFTGATQAINVPYGDTYNQNVDNILNFGDAKSLSDLQSNIDTLYTNAPLASSAQVADGLDWFIAKRDPDGTSGIIIVVGYHDDSNYALTTADLYTLRQEGYKVLTVSVGSNLPTFGDIADKPEWYFQVNDSNGQSIANQISYILCNL